jgi:lipopolysaccharide/colanic/teichoic acid biosynthesis glycosyltransferase
MGLTPQRVVAGVLLILMSPLIIVIGIAVRLTMGKPTLFRQMRAGEGARPFDLMKFRTMRTGLGSDEERLTAFGRWLRRSSIDELPTLWNVLRGEMALVGPRPLLVPYTDRYSQEQARRLEVKPGITGWCQVNGRNSLTWSEKFELDTWYVEHRSLRLDLLILARTGRVVLGGSGVTHHGEATMPEFIPPPCDN